MLFSRILASLAIIFLLSAPLALSAHGFPPKDESTGKVQIVPCKGTAASPCDFPALMHLVRHLIDFAFFIAMPIAVLLFAYAGWLYLSSSASPGNISKAHGIFWAVFIGLLWVLGAWLIIKLISDALLQSAYTVLPS